jgi:hypothetical protein
MPRITKSTLSFATTALTIAQNALPPYSCPKNPHKFTQPQFFAILALRVFLKQDCRGGWPRRAQVRATGAPGIPT